ncbi:MAG: extracellular solute-binding protein, partial [Lachnospiraceae bacterium]|nr:extracellular solute-binding protein [Lachnospiraceae bacterium]
GKTPLIFRVAYANVGLKLLVTKFNQENQEYHVFLQDGEIGTGWDFQERNDLEIATGKGPDLIGENAVSDIYELAEKGALENLEPYFAQEEMSRDAYASAAFQSLGREDGIYGICYEMQAITLYIREELAGNNIETLLDNMENYDGQAIFNSLYNYTPNKLLGYFFRMSDDFYGMVDWEEKTCDFSGELWEKILRVVKQYGVTDRNRQWDEVAMEVSGGQVSSFAMHDAEAMREGMVLAGYPAENGMKHCLSIHGVSVNAASEHKDGAWQFIKFLLEEENQWLVEQDSYLPVHEKVLQECVAAQAEQFYYFYYDTPAVQEEQLARFWECLNSAETAPYRTEHILEIIKEEAELYFTGDKSIEEISGIIENRVRLYLAELE